MKNQDNFLAESLQSISTVLTIALPFLQFAFQTLPQQTITIFLDKNIIPVTTFITFLLSIFVILAYKANPYFKIPLDPKGKEKYLRYLKNIDPKIHSPEQIAKIRPVSPSLELDAKGMALISILFVFISSSLFILIGINFGGQEKISQWIIFIQALLYILTFVFTVFILMTFALDLFQKKQWEVVRKEKIKKAIDLAVSYGSFPEFPKIIYQSANEVYSYPIGLVVTVKIDDNIYLIQTDSQADVLYSVIKMQPNAAG